MWTVAKSFRAAVTGVSVLGPDDVWAFGGAANGGGVFHFNGHSWTEVSATTFQGGSAVSDRDVWAVSGQTVAHFNGRGWSRAAVGPVVVNFGESATSDGKGGLWVVSDTHQNFQQLWHYSAGQITNVTPAEFGPLAVSRIPGTAQALAGGFAPSAAIVDQYS